VENAYKVQNHQLVACEIKCTHFCTWQKVNFSYWPVCRFHLQFTFLAVAWIQL